MGVGRARLRPALTRAEGRPAVARALGSAPFLRVSSEAFLLQERAVECCRNYLYQLFEGVVKICEVQMGVVKEPRF